MKNKLGAKSCIYPMPVILVGANVEGKPNYLTIAHVGILDFKTVSVSMNKIHYTNQGIKENGAFSINIPSVRQVKETDYCGLVSGRKFDKAVLFKTFYGVLETAPMIEECPVNMECKLINTIDMPKHDVFVGEVVESFCEQDGMTGEFIDISKVQPILFELDNRSYFKLGERFADAWETGKELITR